MLGLLPNRESGTPLLSSVSPSDMLLSRVRRKLKRGGEVPFGVVPDAELLVDELDEPPVKEFPNEKFGEGSGPGMVAGRCESA